MTNPKRKHRNRRRRSNARRSRRSNPHYANTRSRRHRNYRRYRRNPIAGFTGKELLQLSIGAAGGAIGSRYLVQLALGQGNSGAAGYAANIAATLLLAWGASKFAGKEVASGVAAGGLGAVLMRIWSENVSGTSPAAMSGYLGDLEFSGNGLGAYIQSSFPLPTVSGQNGNYLMVPAQASWGPVGSPGNAPIAPNASAAPSVNAQPNIPQGLTRFAARF